MFKNGVFEKSLQFSFNNGFQAHQLLNSFEHPVHMFLKWFKHKRVNTVVCKYSFTTIYRTSFNKNRIRFKQVSNNERV